MMSRFNTISIRLESGIDARLGQLADAANRSKSFLAAEAIRAYVELNEWQIREVQIALQEADAGDFARPSEVNKVFRNWRKPLSQW